MDTEVNCGLFIGNDRLKAVNVKTCIASDAKESNTSAVKNDCLNVTSSESISLDHDYTIKHCVSSPETITYPIDINVETLHLEKAVSMMKVSKTKVHPYHYTGPYIKVDKGKMRQKKAFRCPYSTCNQMFHLEAFYNRHLILHKTRNLQCELCHKVYLDKNKLSKHQLQHNGKDGKLKFFQCSVPGCYHLCLSDALLRDHEKTQHNPQTVLYPCDQCSKTFRLKYSYTKHKLNHDKSLLKHCCLECGKHFKTLDLLNLHTKLHRHTNDYVCEMCGLEFNKFGNLKRHEKIHEGKNVFCEICFANFRHLRSLTTHIMENHPNARKKQLQAAKGKKRSRKG